MNLRLASLALLLAATAVADSVPPDAAMPAKRAPTKATSTTSATSATPDSPASPTAAALPDGRTVLKDFVEACGGQGTFEKVENCVLQGKLSIPAQSMDGTLAIYQARPNKVLVNTDLGPLHMTAGYDGTTGWSNDPLQGPRILQGGELAQLRDNGGEIEIFGYANADEHFASATTVGRTTFQGKDAYEVALETKAGEKMTAYFDPVTHLQLGLDATVNSPLGPMAATVTFSDWKTFSGVRIPTTLSQSVVGVAAVTTIESMQINVATLPSFAPPPEVTEAAK